MANRVKKCTEGKFPAQKDSNGLLQSVLAVNNDMKRITSRNLKVISHLRDEGNYRLSHISRDQGTNFTNMLLRAVNFVYSKTN